MRALGPEPKGELVEKDEPKELQPEEGGSLFTHADVKMSEILSSVLSVDVSVTFTFKWCCKTHNLELPYNIRVAG